MPIPVPTIASAPTPSASPTTPAVRDPAAVGAAAGERRDRLAAQRRRQLGHHDDLRRRRDRPARSPTARRRTTSRSSRPTGGRSSTCTAPRHHPRGARHGRRRHRRPRAVRHRAARVRRPHPARLRRPARAPAGAALPRPRHRRDHARPRRASTAPWSAWWTRAPWATPRWPRTAASSCTGSADEAGQEGGELYCAPLDGPARPCRSPPVDDCATTTPPCPRPATVVAFTRAGQGIWTVGLGRSTTRTSSSPSATATGPVVVAGRQADHLQAPGRGVDHGRRRRATRTGSRSREMSARPQRGARGNGPHTQTDERPYDIRRIRAADRRLLIEETGTGGDGWATGSASTSARPTRPRRCNVDGRVEMLGLGIRAMQVPSVVFVRRDGEIVVGEAAEQQGAAEPSRVVREFKRRIGDSVPLVVGGAPFSAQALTARLLAWVVGVATERQGGPPEHVCVTHPGELGAVQARPAGPGGRDGGPAERARSAPSPRRRRSPTRRATGWPRATGSRCTTWAAARSTPRCWCATAPGSGWPGRRRASSSWAGSTSTRPCSGTS